MATFTERAMDAVHSFITDGTYGLNAETLPALRTALSLSTAQLPNVAIFEKWYHRSSQATEFPYMSIVVDSSTGETDGTNARMYQVSLSLALVVLDANIDGDEPDVVQALWRYGDAIKTLAQRRVPMSRQGWTLSASPGIIRSAVTDQTPGADPTISAPNVVLITGLSVVTAEAF